jgi:hypothetical protein
MHAAAAPLNEEQHIPPLQPDRLNREEVDREQAASMDPNESIGPPLRHQLSMPSQQRFGRHNEGSPVLSRQEPARRRQKQRIDRSHRRAPGLPMQDGEFVPTHSDSSSLTSFERQRHSASGRTRRRRR